MNKPSTLSLLLFILLMLSACTAAEYLIKKAVNGFQGDITKELKGLADFSAEQEEAIDAVAAATDAWMRSDRLTSVESLILLLANDVERQGKIESDNWYQVASFLGTGLALSGNPQLVDDYAKLTSSLTAEQVSQVIARFEETLQEDLEKSEDRTIDKQNERIVDGLKWVFRAIDQPLSRDQRNYAEDFLGARRVDFDYQRQIAVKETEQLGQIIKNAQTQSGEQTSAEILAFFKQVEAQRSVPSEADWRHNVDLFLELINHFLIDFDEQQRANAAMELRGYAQIFNDLAIPGD
ncbi:MAG: hypothetical protein KTR16_06745 [Acidiferrobacterales bacterium]|nr:hypothetical protein [Acidiferrobacterales bacterium]